MRSLRRATLVFTCSEAQEKTKVGRGWGMEGRVSMVTAAEEPEAHV